MLNSGKKFRATKKINILILVLSEKNVLNETKNFKLNGRSFMRVGLVQTEHSHRHHHHPHHFIETLFVPTMI
jgi:hypothetical protein